MPPLDPWLMANFLLLFLAAFIPVSLAASIVLAPVVWGVVLGLRALLTWGPRDRRQNSN
jgi:hypothetical protein